MRSKRILSEKDYKLIERLMLMKQYQTRHFLTDFIKENYDDCICTTRYIIAKGDIPVALVAHMDTVWETDFNHEIFYDMRKNVMLNLNGGGYDDKIGIFLIMKLIQEGFRPHVIFTTDEESGCLGASDLVKDYPTYPFEDLSYLIQLDRRHENDCVFYDCDNEAFEQYIESFGFKTAYGSYSDICELCPAWGIAGVNLSVGYDKEHTLNERLYVDHMYHTLDRVKVILLEDKFPVFEYIPMDYTYSNYYGYYGWQTDYPYESEIDNPIQDYWGYSPDPDHIYTCEYCGQSRYEREIFPVLMLDGSMKYCCSDCAIIDNGMSINWCDRCYRTFEIDPTDPNSILCPECKEIERKRIKTYISKDKLAEVTNDKHRRNKN